MKSIAGSTMRLIVCFLQFVALTTLASGAYALDLDQMVDFNIPKQKLDSALVQFSEQAKIQITSSSDQVKDLSTDGIVGRYRVSMGLKTLLQHSGLSYRPIGQSAISIGQFSAGSEQSTTQNASTGGGKESSQDFRVAQMDQGKASVAASVGSQSSNSQGSSNEPSTGISEIVVTAQKRVERLQDVPVPVTVLSADSLVQSDQVRLQDYYNKVPGLGLTVGGDAETPYLAIRNIPNSSAGAPSVGVVIDDVPYGSTVGLGGRGQPDIDPGDLARIEVLRGPQGTLYGASSMGGLLKFVTVDLECLDGWNIVSGHRMGMQSCWGSPDMVRKLRVDRGP